MTVEGGWEDYGVREMAYGPLYIAIAAGTVLAIAGIAAGVFWYVRRKRRGEEAGEQSP
jgi:hypothetical protein